MVEEYIVSLARRQEFVDEGYKVQQQAEETMKEKLIACISR